MNTTQVIQIVQEELSEAEARIIKRLNTEDKAQEKSIAPLKPLPDNENYARALKSYLNGGTHSGTAKTLGVSMAQIKKYYTWLAKNGYLPKEDVELSDTEQRVVDYIYGKKMSLRETAKELDCSISNVTYRRDSALRKGYVPEDAEEIKE